MIDKTDGVAQTYELIVGPGAGIIGLKIADRVRSIIGKSITGKSL